MASSHCTKVAVLMFAAAPEETSPADRAAPISDSDQDTLPAPLTDLAALPMVRVRAVPQFYVVILAVPSKLVPLIVLAVTNLVADTALAVAASLVAAKSYAAFTPAVVAYVVIDASLV